MKANKKSLERDTIRTGTSQDREREETPKQKHSLLQKKTYSYIQSEYVKLNTLSELL